MRISLAISCSGFVPVFESLGFAFCQIWEIFSYHLFEYLFQLHASSPLFWDAHDTNARSFVIITQISQTLFISFFSLFPFLLLRLGRFQLSVFNLTHSFPVVSNLLSSPSFGFLFQLLYLSVLSFPTGCFFNSLYSFT